MDLHGNNQNRKNLKILYEKKKMQNAKMDIGLFGMFHHLYFQQERVQTNFFTISKAMFITFPLLSS